MNWKRGLGRLERIGYTVAAVGVLLMTVESVAAVFGHGFGSVGKGLALLFFGLLVLLIVFVVRGFLTEESPTAENK